jgi:sugar phosphate isomerase/epimerase
MIQTRRSFSRLALAALPAARSAAAINSTFNGVRLGIGSYSFRAFSLNQMVSQMEAIPLGELELESWFVEPAALTVAVNGRGPITPAQRDALRKWRLTVPLDELRGLRRKFDGAGIHLYAYNIPVDATFTDDELDRVFLMAKALGIRMLNVVTTLSAAPLLVAPSAHHGMRIGFHPSGGAPTQNSIGTGDSYRKLIALAPNFGLNPDLGQSASWGPDPLAFLREMHGRITTLHTHDRRLTPGVGRGSAFVPLGEGQMPIREILRLLKEEKYSFVPMIERIHSLEGTDNVTELRRAVQYCKEVLASP